MHMEAEENISESEASQKQTKARIFNKSLSDCFLFVLLKQKRNKTKIPIN